MHRLLLVLLLLALAACGDPCAHQEQRDACPTAPRARSTTWSTPDMGTTPDLATTQSPACVSAGRDD